MSNLKILILCSYFPPTMNGGSSRPHRFAKSLSVKNDVTVCTTSNNGPYITDSFRVVYLDFWRVRTKYIVSKILSYVLFNLGLVRFKDYYLERQFFKKNKDKYDIVIATYPELINLIIGAKIVESSPETKLIIDFRDGMCFEPLVRYVNPIVKNNLVKLEKYLCSRSSHIITVGEALTDYFKEINENCSTIYNSHDKPARLYGSKLSNSSRIRIVHFGSLGLSKERNLNFLSVALEQLCAIELPLEIVFVGNLTNKEKTILGRANPSISFRLPVDKSEKQALFSDFDAALFIGVPSQVSYISSKIFDYIEAGLPILGVCKGNEAELIINTEGLGLVSDFEPASIVSMFESFYNQGISKNSYANRFKTDVQMNKLEQLCLNIYC